jgi:uncharacterized protein (TIGR03435 family)
MKLAAVLWLAIAGCAVGQTAPVKQFEVASLKRVVGMPGPYSFGSLDAERFTARNVPLQVLIAVAYDMDSRYVTGGPGWVASEFYSVEAKPDGDAPVGKEEMRSMLQQLLKERLHLAVHRERHESSGYALVVAKGGAKLHPVKEGVGQFNILPDGLLAHGASTGTLAGMLSAWLKQPVVDATGIDGLYDINLKFAPAGATESELPSIFTAVQEQLGLKLEPRKVPVENLVVDHVEKEPVDN